MFKQIFLMSLISVAALGYSQEVPLVSSPSRSGKAFFAKVMSAELKAQKPTFWQPITSTICAHPYIAIASAFLAAYAGYKIYENREAFCRVLGFDVRKIAIDSLKNHKKEIIPSAVRGTCQNMKYTSERFSFEYGHNYYKSHCMLPITKKQYRISDFVLRRNITIDNKSRGNTFIISSKAPHIILTLVKYGPATHLDSLADMFKNLVQGKGADALTMPAYSSGLVDIIIECPEQLFSKISIV